MIQVISNKAIKKSRKEHRCSYCNGVIEVGERYRRVKLKHDYDGPYEWIECQNCEIVVKEFFGSGYFEDDGNGLTTETYEELVSEIHEEFFMQDRYLKFSLPKISEDLADQFKTHQLVLTGDGGYFKSWMLVKRKLNN